MNIQYPPMPNSQLSPFGIDDIDFIRQLSLYLKDKDFDSRYFSQFGWFQNSLVDIETILNIGCGRGRETLALLWTFRAARAIGIDIDEKKIKFAQDISKRGLEFCSKFHTQILPRISDLKYTEQLRIWYETNLPLGFRQDNLPGFIRKDISLKFSPHPGYFDLIYCRYVLYKIAGQGESEFLAAIKNIAELITPKSGRVVVVEPTKENEITFNFEPIFKDVGLKVVQVEKDETCLGWLEPFDTKTYPKGYVLEHS